MPRINRRAPIGVFDSGLGGLTVVKELIRQLPREDIVYFGDTARVPYGSKSKESIVRFSFENTDILLRYKIKLLVVACNSSSSYAIAALKRKYSFPIIGVTEPGVIKAAGISRNNRIGVIATQATIGSKAYTRLLQRFGKSLKVFTRACPLFVPLVEEGLMNKKITEDAARLYLKPLKAKNIDTLILGCTHYPLLKRTIGKVMGKKVVLIDSAKEVAAKAERILRENNINNVGQRKPKYKFLISDKPQEFSQMAKNFLGRNIVAVKI